jgi:glucosamine--fructose-6-phosphate aminotransferase (isomerizing)
MYAAALFREEEIIADAYLASEYAGSPPPVDSGTMVIGVTQSGETADTLSAIRVASRTAATTLTVTNVVGSSVASKTDHAVLISAGPEIGVAATKTFSSQVASLLMFAAWFEHGDESSVQDWELTDGLNRLPEYVDLVLSNTTADSSGRRSHNSAA